MTRMFKLWKDSRIATVNPFNGCEFDCYGGNCWAAQMARRLRGAGRRGYENGFKPSFCPWRMEVPDADVVWIGSMGDIAFQEKENIMEIVEKMIKPNPETLFFLETKKPVTYDQFIDVLPSHNVLLSTTIESNRAYPVTLARPPEERFKDFKKLDWELKHVSVEPIMDFDLDKLTDWLAEIEPEGISLGYGNQYVKGQLPEPPLTKTMELIGKLEDSGIGEVERKDLRERVEGERSRKVRKEFRRGNTDWYRKQSEGNRRKQDVINGDHNEPSIQSEGFLDWIKKWMTAISGGEIR